MVAFDAPIAESLLLRRLTMLFLTPRAVQQILKILSLPASCVMQARAPRTWELNGYLPFYETGYHD